MIARISDGEFASMFHARGRLLAWFLGAGASAAGNIPTGYDMILDFKAQLFSRDADIARREIDTGDPVWIERLNSYFNNSHGLPPTDSPDEYATAFEAVLSDPADRRRYIDETIRRGSPSYGHRVLAALVANRQIPCIFETNFDPLMEDAVAVADDLLPPSERVHLTTAAIDSAGRAELCLRESSWPLLAKLHGDYREEALKNSAAELKEQDAAMRRVLVECLGRFGLVVVGYSGRDDSVMAALGDALAPGAYPGGIFWVCRSDRPLLPAVSNFLNTASDAAIDAYVVHSETFDELAGELHRAGELPNLLQQSLESARPVPRLKPVVVPTESVAYFPVLQCSALPILEFPVTARRILLREDSSTPELQALLRTANCRQTAIACIGREAAAFGRDRDLIAGLSSLRPQLSGEIPLNPLLDSWALGLLYDALAKALSRTRPLIPHLRSHGHHLIVAPPDPTRDDDRAIDDRRLLKALGEAYDKPLTGNAGLLNLPYAEAVRLVLDHRLGRWWCVFDPFTWIDFPRSDPHEEGDRSTDDTGEVQSEAADEQDPERSTLVHAAAEWRRERWATRRNLAWASILRAWGTLLSNKDELTISSFGHGSDEGHTATFMLGTWTAWSRPGGHGT